MTKIQDSPSKFIANHSDRSVIVVERYHWSDA
jgi:hypothetical protein